MSDVLERSIVHNLTHAAAEYAAAARGAGTCRAYDSQWRQFVNWCEAEGFGPYSGEATIALNITSMARDGLSISTIDMRLAAISHEYQKAEVPLNVADNVLGPVREGIARTVGTAARRKAMPIRPADLRAMLGTRRPSTHALGARDRFLLLLGFGSALRRSELVALAMGDVTEVPGGLRVTIRRSKTDQTGGGATVYVASNPRDAEFCVVVAWRRWSGHRLTAPDMDVPPAARSMRPLLCGVNKWGCPTAKALPDQMVALTIKDAAEAAGMDPSAYSGHSLRRGLLTSGAEAGADLKALMRQGRHKDPGVALGYIDEANPWADNVSGAVFGGAG